MVGACCPQKNCAIKISKPTQVQTSNHTKGVFYIQGTLKMVSKAWSICEVGENMRLRGGGNFMGVWPHRPFIWKQNAAWMSDDRGDDSGRRCLADKEPSRFRTACSLLQPSELHGPAYLGPEQSEDDASYVCWIFPLDFTSLLGTVWLMVDVYLLPCVWSQHIWLVPGSW